MLLVPGPRYHMMIYYDSNPSLDVQDLRKRLKVIRYWEAVYVWYDPCFQETIEEPRLESVLTKTRNHGYVMTSLVRYQVAFP